MRFLKICKFYKSFGFWIQFVIWHMVASVYFLEIDGTTESGKIRRTFTPGLRHGMEWHREKWPWHASILKGQEDTVSYFCGGSIVDRVTVLTAAHCFYNNATEKFALIHDDKISVSSGNKYIDEISASVQVSFVKEIIIHPKYNRTSLAHDIAILKLSVPLNRTYRVQPVPIWSADSDQNPIVGTSGTVIGFGFNADGDLSDRIQEATFTVLDNESCIEYDPETYRKHLTRDMFCARGKNNVSACHGDSGGGMFFNIDGIWQLRGIVSYSASRNNTDDDVCDPTKPTVFTDVSKYREWVLRYTNTTKWLKELKPCTDEMINKDTMCNAASRSDDGFLIVQTENNIIRISMNGDSVSSILQDSNNSGLGGFDYDCVGRRLYWTEPGTRTIFSARYDGTDKKAFITKDLVDPRHVAVDWISRRLYWVDYEKETIEVASLDNPDMRTLVTTNVDDPAEIVVNPVEGKLYRVHQYVEIERSNLDGSEQSRLLESNTLRISDVQVSMATTELCYVIREASKVECVHTHSKEVRTIVTNITNPNKLAIKDEQFYWTDFNTNMIKSVNHRRERQQSIRFDSTGNIITFKAVSDVCPVVYSPCAIDNGNCPESTICLPNPREESGKTCKCTENCTDIMSSGVSVKQ